MEIAANRSEGYFPLSEPSLNLNPASSVRGPKHVVKRGKTPVLKADQARALLDDHLEAQAHQPFDRLRRSRDTRLVRVKLTRDEYRLPHRMILSAGT